ncbi:MAG: hypothetical protein AB3N22_08465 [Ruegeria sp.]
MSRIPAALGGLLLATSATAQTLISPEDFLDAAEGKTLSFYEVRSGELVGVEQFLDRSRSVWKQVGEHCVYGRISTPGGRICFLYDNDPDRQPVCWWPFMQGDRLMVRLATFLDAEIQEVRSITSDPISCPGELTS